MVSAYLLSTRTRELQPSADIIASMRVEKFINTLLWMTEMELHCSGVRVNLVSFLQGRFE